MVLVLVLALFAGLDSVAQRFLVTQSFEELERREAGRDLRRAVGAVDDAIHGLEVLSANLAGWLADTEQASFTNSPILPTVSLEERELDLLLVCDNEGRFLVRRLEHPGTRAPMTLRDIPNDALASTHPLLLQDEQGNRPSGVMMTELAPLLISSSSVPGSADRANSPTTVIVGRFLTEELAGRMGQRVHVRFGMWALSGDDLPDGAAAIAESITSSPGPVLVPRSDETLDVFTSLEDYRGLPSLLLRATVERTIMAESARAIGGSLLSAASIAVFLMFVLVMLLQRIVTGPLVRLTDKAVEIGRRDDPAIRMSVDSDDEIGILAREFDSVLEKLERSRLEKVDAARAAGMSEISTGILHNVGNALNSLNISVHLAEQSMHRLPLRDLQAIVRELDEHSGRLDVFLSREERGQYLLTYIEQVTTNLAKRRATSCAELKSAIDSVDHLMQVVATQQVHSGHGGVIEWVELAAQVDAALEVTLQAHEMEIEPAVVREYAELDRCQIDRHRVMTILINFVLNALESVAASGTKSPELTLRVYRPTPEEVCLEVSDNGVGIAEKDLTTIFQYGYSTKPEGHGYGLHVNANMATELNGSVSAQSPGPGRGATFTLRMPFQPEEASEPQRAA